MSIAYELVTRENFKEIGSTLRDVIMKAFNFKNNEGSPWPLKSLAAKDLDSSFNYIPNAPQRFMRVMLTEQDKCSIGTHCTYSIINRT